jgi:probable rRNA maturation factor
MDDTDTSSSEPPSGRPDDGRDPAARFELLDPDGRLSAGQHARIASLGLEALRTLRARGEVRALIVDDARMSEAHARYAGVGGTTDVLTFDLSGGDGHLDADLLVCIDEARRQGEALGHEPERELLLYILHGVLHCLGHDDHDEDRARRMHEEEDRVLTAIGVGPVYAPGGGGRA